MRRFLALVLLAVLFPVLAVRSDTTNNPPTAVGDPRLKTFAAQKHLQAEALAVRLHFDLSKEVREFFRAAEAGDLDAIDRYKKVYRATESSVAHTPFLGLDNALFAPVQETLSAYWTFGRWDATMLQKFADGILKSIPPGSVYFGGTDAGRFVITAVRDTAGSPDIFIITQSGVGEPRYMDYLRLIYGKRLSMPGDTDVDAALKQYADEFKTRTASPNGEVTVDKDGHVSIHGIDGVIAVNNTLTKWIFDHNKDKHEFYVEENDPAPWMYPYMEPHGLILKLNKEPVKELDPAVVAQDRQFWNALTKELLSDKHFSDSREARKVFCKLRTAIGGMYVGRHLTTEAEGAFWQALDLDPASSETNFRLVQLYVEQDRFDEAIAVIEQYQSRVGSANQDDRQRLAQAIEQIRELKRQAEEKKPSTNPP